MWSIVRLMAFLLLLPGAANACGFKYVDQVETPPGIATYSTRRLRDVKYNGTQVPEWSPLRVYTVYDDQLDVALPDELDQRDLSNYVTRALRRLSQMLKVRSTLSVEASCGGTSVTAEFGYNFVLFIKVIVMPPGHDDTLAQAGGCGNEELRLDASTGRVYYKYKPDFNKPGNTPFPGRPLGGHMEVNLAQFKNRDKRMDADKWVSTMMHEISHALVFSPGLYKNFINCDDGSGECKLYPDQDPAFPRRPSQNDPGPFEIPGIVKKVEYDWLLKTGEKKHAVHVFMLPKAKKAAQDYFNCPNLEGVELENQGNQGTAFAHLEKRIYQQDTMGGIRTEVNAFSTITLGVFADSGWYKVDFSQADDMNFGKGMGCDFAMKSCAHSVSNDYPYCLHDEQRCSPDHNNIVRCNAWSYALEGGGIPTEYDYAFELKKSPRINYPPGNGPIAYADFCPFYSIYTKKDGKSNSSCASIEYSQTANETLQIFSKTSKCVQLVDHDGLHVKTTEATSATGTNIQQFLQSHGCYDTKCEDGRLWIRTAKSKFYPCYKTGQKIHVERRLLDSKKDIQFQLLCPRCSDICGAANCTSHPGDTEKANQYVGDKSHDSPSLLDRLLGKGGRQTMDMVTMSLIIVSSVFAICY